MFVDLVQAIIRKIWQVTKIAKKITKHNLFPPPPSPPSQFADSA